MRSDRRVTNNLLCHLRFRDRNRRRRMFFFAHFQGYDIIEQNKTKIYFSEYCVPLSRAASLMNL